MITVTLSLSESLLSIFRDNGNPLPETIEVRADPGTTVGEVILSQGISPLLVPMVAQATPDGRQRISKETVLETSVELTLYGPLAGG